MFLLLSCASTPKVNQPKHVLYGVSPSFFSADENVSGLDAIRMRLPEIKELGANVVWLMPVTPPADEDGPGYDVVDYKSVWSQIGGEEDLKELVSEAHSRNMKVLLDVVLNHSSIHHPFVKDIKKQGKKSPYHDLYQHEPLSGVPYAEHFHKRKVGNTTFIYYFWEDLLNFNYQNQELRDYLFDVVAFWVKEYDVDGFRFDASWAPSSRWPDFYKELAAHLRKIKPGIILLAEDAAGYPAKYEGTGHPHLKGSGFDLAYDWDTNAYAVSKWAYQMDDDNDEQTLFNLTEGEEAAELFYAALKHNQPVEGIKVLRYVENNDSSGILVHHDWNDARWATTVNFLLPGVPLIFYGQEAGIKRHQHELPGFDVRKKMASFNPKAWKFYRDLINYRQSSDVLSLGKMKNLNMPSATTVSYELHHEGKKALILLDFTKKQASVDGTPVGF